MSVNKQNPVLLFSSNTIDTRKRMIEIINEAVALCFSVKNTNKGVLDHPQNMVFGDYTTNVAMLLAKKLKKNPNEIAKEIAGKIEVGDKSGFLEKVEVVGGYINFTLKKSWLARELNKVLEQRDKYGFNNSLKDKKVLVEFTDPNPFKEMHIGHLFSNTVGESIARLYETTGATVRRANYQGDVGMHVAKAVWGLRKKLKEENITIEILSEKSLADRVHFLGQAYALGATAYKEDKALAEEIKDYNYLCYLAGQERLSKEEGLKPQVNYKQYVEGTTLPYEEVKVLYFKGREWSLEYFESIYKQLGTKFDYYFFESLAGEYGKKYVEDNLKKGIFKKSKGAIVYDGEKEGLHTRVFINSLGLPTYEAKDLGLASTKYEKFKYDTSVIVTGNEINEYFKVILSALSKINPELAEKTTHIGHGMLRLPEGKMSSRTGKVITAEWLISEVVNRLKTLVDGQSTSKGQISITELDKIAVGAIKYAILRSDIRKDLIFNFETSLAFDGNSGPYLQYAYARCRSILREVGKSLSTKIVNTEDKLADAYKSKEEVNMLRTLYKYPEIVAKALSELSPHLLCSYLFDLAQKFSVFYDRCPVLKAEDKKVREARLLLVVATAQVIKSGLYLLGIDVLEKM